MSHQDRDQRRGLRKAGEWSRFGTGSSAHYLSIVPPRRLSAQEEAHLIDIRVAALLPSDKLDDRRALRGVLGTVRREMAAALGKTVEAVERNHQRLGQMTEKRLLPKKPS